METFAAIRGGAKRDTVPTNGDFVAVPAAKPVASGLSDAWGFRGGPAGGGGVEVVKFHDSAGRRMCRE